MGTIQLMRYCKSKYKPSYRGSWHRNYSETHYRKHGNFDPHKEQIDLVRQCIIAAKILHEVELTDGLIANVYTRLLEPHPVYRRRRYIGKHICVEAQAMRTMNNI